MLGLSDLAHPASLYRQMGVNRLWFRGLTPVIRDHSPWLLSVCRGLLCATDRAVYVARCYLCATVLAVYSAKCLRDRGLRRGISNSIYICSPLRFISAVKWLCASGLSCATGLVVVGYRYRDNTLYINTMHIFL